MDTEEQTMAIPAAVLGKPRLPEVGHLKLGGKGEERKSKGGGTYNIPVKYESWVITTRRRDGVNLAPDDDLMAALEEYNRKYADHEDGQPRRIPIFLPYNDQDANFYDNLAYYAGRKRACWNDTGGPKAIRRFRGQQEVDPYEVECPCPLLEQGKCKWHGALRVMLRLPGSGMGGFFTFRTTSKNSIRNIRGGMARFAYETGGVLAGLPLELVCNKQTVRTPDDKDMNAMIAYLDYPGDPEQFLAETVAVRQRHMERREILGQLGLKEKRLLISFQSEDEDANAEDINAEFSPETANRTPAQVMKDDPPEGETTQTSTRKRSRPAKKEEPKPDPEPVEAEFTPPEGADDGPPPDSEPPGDDLDDDLSGMFQ